jgi:hypothetical protein
LETYALGIARPADEGRLRMSIGRHGKLHGSRRGRPGHALPHVRLTACLDRLAIICERETVGFVIQSCLSVAGIPSGFAFRSGRPFSGLCRHVQGNKSGESEHCKRQQTHFELTQLIVSHLAGETACEDRRSSAPRAIKYRRLPRWRHRPARKSRMLTTKEWAADLPAEPMHAGTDTTWALETWVLSRCRGRTVSVLHRRGAASTKISARLLPGPAQWLSA